MKIFITLLLLLIITSCQKLRYGNVIEKDYNPEWSQIMFIPMTMSDGKNTTTTMIPYFVHHNESWSIDVKGIGTKGDTITRTFYISQYEYDTTKIGSFLCVDGKCTDDTAIHKTKQ